MKFSTRELILAWITGIVILAGVSYVLSIPKIKVWKKLRHDKADITRQIDVTSRLLAQKPKWEARLEQQRRNLAEYSADKDVTADVLIRLEALSGQHNIKLLSREVDKETPHGDFHDMSVNCKWEGNLEGIVAFLFELQQENAMLDAVQLSIAPNEKRVLRGNLTVNSAYCRKPTMRQTNQPPMKVEGR